jgi:hypothetical protein
MITVLVISFLGLILLASFLTFDRLVYIEYKSYRRNWEADGKPHGFFWIPREVTRLGGRIIGVRSSIASQKCAFVWVFSTPNWVRENESASRLLLRFRLLFGVWNLTSLLILLFIFLH